MYRDLLGVTRWCVGYARAGAAELADWSPPSPGDVSHLLEVLDIRSELTRFAALAGRVLRQHALLDGDDALVDEVADLLTERLQLGR